VGPSTALSACSQAIFEERKGRRSINCEYSSYKLSQSGAPIVLIGNRLARLVLARPHHSRAGSSGKRPPRSESDGVAAGVGGSPAALGRAEEHWISVPGSAPDDKETAIPGGPSRAICRRPIVITMIAVLYPLPDIAGHVM
jgi:hypothetical protein